MAVTRERLQERCTGFTHVADDLTETEYTHNQRMWLDHEAVLQPDGTNLVTWRKWCQACDDAKEDLDAQ